MNIPARVGSTNGEVTAEALWNPAITGHICLMVSVCHPWDLDLDNNNGQENTDVHPVSSPATVTFTLSNPSDEVALIYLEARQIGSGNLWPVEIQRNYPQVQSPGENKTIKITINAPEDVKGGERRSYVIHAYLDGKLIGGVEIDFFKTRFISTTSSSSITSSFLLTTTNITTFSSPSSYFPLYFFIYGKRGNNSLFLFF